MLKKTQKLKSIPLKLAVFLAAMWKPCQRNYTNSLESGFHMALKKTFNFNGIDFNVKSLFFIPTGINATNMQRQLSSGSNASNSSGSGAPMMGGNDFTPQQQGGNNMMNNFQQQQQQQNPQQMQMMQQQFNQQQQQNNNQFNPGGQNPFSM